MKIKIGLRGFSLAFVIYVLVLALLVGAALVYVDSVLDEYEDKHPARILEEAIVKLKSEAEDGTLYQKDGAPDMVSTKYEEGVDPKADFVNKLSRETKFTAQKWISDSECVYGVVSDGIVIAEITLRKVGEPITKLAIITMQEYELVSYLPVSHTYKIELDCDVLLGDEMSLSFNGITLTEDDAKKTDSNTLLFTLSGIYNKPDVKLTDANGRVAQGRVTESVDSTVEFDAAIYTLTLPKQIFVDLDGERMTGELLDDGRYEYRIRIAGKAKVELSDLFGNKIEYVGAANVPLTYYTLMTSEGCTVKVNGNDVPESVMEISSNPEYKNFAELVPGLPKLPVYNIVVLENDAQVLATNSKGENIELEPDKNVQDLTGMSAPESLPTVPDEIAKEIDVIAVLKDWSLFMSCDLDFYSLSKHLIKNSYQYNIAYKYNYSIDRTFTSIHTLKDPAFTEETATNFTWLTENCFSVDVRFVKHMLVSGKHVDDEMNERCYFAKDSANTWKLIGMKEVIGDAK